MMMRRGARGRVCVCVCGRASREGRAMLLSRLAGWLAGWLAGGRAGGRAGRVRRAMLWRGEGRGGWRAWPGSMTRLKFLSTTCDPASVSGYEVLEDHLPPRVTRPRRAGKDAARRAYAAGGVYVLG